MALKAGSQRPVAVARSGMGGQRHGRSPTAIHGTPASDSPYQRVSIFARHADVADEEIATTPVEDVDRFSRRCSNDCFGASVADNHLEQLARFSVIVDDQHGDAL